MANPLVDISGQRFGRLVVLERAPNAGQATQWVCQCDCGNKTTVRSGNLRKELTKSCGCIKRDGKPKSTEFTLSTRKTESSPGGVLWIKDRCTCGHERLSHIEFRSVCERCPNACAEFISVNAPVIVPVSVSVVKSTTKRQPKQRVYNNKHNKAKPGTKPYENGAIMVGPGTVSDRRIVAISYNNKTQSLADWSKELDIKRGTLQMRIARGWPLERVFSKG